MGMRKEAIVLLMVLLVLASGLVGYLVGVTSHEPNQTTTPMPSQPHEQISLAASCFPFGNTGAIIATNTGTKPVNLTEVTISDSSGIHIAETFQYGIVVNSGNYVTLSQGIAYSGSNVTIEAVSEYGTIFTTSCHGVSN
jgi:hypothetical protein